METIEKKKKIINFLFLCLVRQPMHIGPMASIRETTCDDVAIVRLLLMCLQIPRRQEKKETLYSSNKDRKCLKSSNNSHYPLLERLAHEAYSKE